MERENNLNKKKLYMEEKRMICPRCKAELSGTERSCHNCGYPVSDIINENSQQSTNESKNSKKTLKIVIIIGTVLIVLILVLAFLVFYSTMKNNNKNNEYNSSSSISTQTPVEKESEKSTKSIVLPKKQETESVKDTNQNNKVDVAADKNSNATNNPSTDNKFENTETSQSPKTKSPTISVEEISSILTTNNNNVIDTLGLSDSDLIKSFNDSNFYEPVFRCEKLGVLIGFNGASFDTIDKVRKENETPNFIIPINGTEIKFDNNINFRVGDNITQFEAKFGEGKTGKDANLKGDKQFCFRTYDIKDLEIRFTSLNGDDFKKYDVYIFRLE